jgi:hypothetical protein
LKAEALGTGAPPFKMVADRSDLNVRLSGVVAVERNLLAYEHWFLIESASGS